MPSLPLILGLAALRMFWAIFIFGFCDSSSFKVIPLKAVVLPLLPGLFPSPHEPSQRVQHRENLDLPGKPSFQGAGRTTRPAKTSQPARIGGMEKGQFLVLYLITSRLHGFQITPALGCFAAFSHINLAVYFFFFF